MNINKSRSLCGSVNSLLTCESQNGRSDSPMRQINQMKKMASGLNRSVYSTIKIGSGGSGSAGVNLNTGLNNMIQSNDKNPINTNTIIKKRNTNQILVTSNNSTMKQLGTSSFKLLDIIIILNI